MFIDIILYVVVFWQIYNGLLFDIYDMLLCCVFEHYVISAPFARFGKYTTDIIWYIYMVLLLWFTI